MSDCTGEGLFGPAPGVLAALLLLLRLVAPLQHYRLLRRLAQARVGGLHRGQKGLQPAQQRAGRRRGDAGLGPRLLLRPAVHQQAALCGGQVVSGGRGTGALVSELDVGACIA